MDKFLNSILCTFLLYTPMVMSQTAPYGVAQEELPALKAKYHRPDHIPFPDDNKYSTDKMILGKALFFDPRLSNSGTTSCATCHNPGLSWTDGLARGLGEAQESLPRKTPTIQNLAWDELYFWDGRAESLEEQALMPITSSKEMNMSMEKVIEKLKSIKGYQPLFHAAFPSENPVTDTNISHAIATFIREQVSGIAPFDRWIEGDEKAISESAKRGFILFNGKGNCASCHSDWRFSDGSFHDIGLDSTDIGRGKQIPRLTLMQHAFKTVGLRNIARRAPYMHDGSLPTLEAVIDHYNDGFINRPSLANDIKPLNLNQQEKIDLVEFLNTLTSETTAVSVPVLPK